MTKFLLKGPLLWGAMLARGGGKGFSIYLNQADPANLSYHYQRLPSKCWAQVETQCLTLMTPHMPKSGQ